MRKRISVRWFPHTWSEDKKTRFIARNKVEAGDALYEITRILRRRAEQGNSYSGNNNVGSPHHIFFAADRELLEDELITNYIYGQENNYGLATVFLADSYENLRS